jgi:hypothetical protein
MKFNKTVTNLLVEFEGSEEISISIPVKSYIINNVLNILEECSKLISKNEDRDLYKKLVSSYFDLKESLKEPVDRHDDLPPSEEETTIVGDGGGTTNYQFDVDNAVETLAAKPTGKIGAFGVGTSAYKAKQAVKQRENLHKTAIDRYAKNTQSIAKAIQNMG